MNHLSVQKNLDTFFKPASLRSKTSTTSEPSIDENVFQFTVFKQRLCSDIRLISSALLISLNFPIICFLIFFYFSGLLYFTNPDYHLIQMTSPPINPD
jgi:hypothetical protein